MSGVPGMGLWFAGAGIALFLLLLALEAVLVLLAYGAARPLRGSVRDRVRLATLLAEYDLWLDRYGVPGRRRKDLREELRTNLVEASDRVGMAAALRAVRPVRRLAAEGETREDRPRWTRGLLVGALWFGAAVLVETVAWSAWAAAADASGSAVVRGSLPLFPGSSASFVREPGPAFSLDFGWLALAVAVLAFLVASRPWRLLRAPGRVGVSG